MSRRRPNKPFWENVQMGAPGECWPWLGYRKNSGHGLTRHLGTMMYASRKAWILTHGVIEPNTLCVNHTCDNAQCCNPAHMYLGTRTDNMRDMWGTDESPRERGCAGKKKISISTKVAIAMEYERGIRIEQIANDFGIGLTAAYSAIRMMRKLRRVSALCTSPKALD